MTLIKGDGSDLWVTHLIIGIQMSMQKKIENVLKVTPGLKGRKIKKWGQIYFFLSPLVATKIAEKPGPENNHE